MTKLLNTILMLVHLGRKTRFQRELETTVTDRPSSFAAWASDQTPARPEDYTFGALWTRFTS